MVIDKVGNIKNIVDPKSTKSVSKSKGVKKSDKLEISSEAKKAAELAQYTKIVKDSPDIRKEKVEAIKAMIKDGSYDKIVDNKILELVADKIADNLLRK